MTENFRNDVVIVSVERGRWVNGVLAQNVPDGETGNQVVVAVLKGVYDAWAK